MFTTFPDLYSTTYGWSPGISGLAYLGTAFGFIVSTLIGVPMLSKSYRTVSKKSYSIFGKKKWPIYQLTERNNGISKPEFRIPVMFLGSLFVPVGLFWYGWSAQAKTTWIMPIIGTAIFVCPPSLSLSHISYLLFPLTTSQKGCRSNVCLYPTPTLPSRLLHLRRLRSGSSIRLSSPFRIRIPTFWRTNVSKIRIWGWKFVVSWFSHYHGYTVSYIFVVQRRAS